MARPFSVLAVFGHTATKITQEENGTHRNHISVERFVKNENGFVATIRRELGSDIDAACGQLRRKNLKK